MCRRHQVAIATGFAVWFVGLVGCATTPPHNSVPQTRELPGFQRSPYFDEQIRSYTYDPNVSVLINAPAAARFDPNKPTRLVIYALPNGNTIAQTIGREWAEGVDWHFFIQHIGAQTRLLRNSLPDENLVVAYVEAGGRSWPAWRSKHPDNGALIARLVDSLREPFGPQATVELTCHSGGGSFIFGFVNHAEEIPDWVERIVFLDANYGYSDNDQHGDKFVRWLEASSRHYLGVYCYDDRRIRVDGKLVVGPTGGTYRRTQTMLERFRQDLTLHEDTHPNYCRYRGLDGRLDVIVVDNPQDKILHTVLVERNGFIHGLTFGTAQDERLGRFFGPATYAEWIQPE